MKDIILILFIILALWISAVAHEADMVRNFEATGDAKPWFGELKR